MARPSRCVDHRNVALDELTSHVTAMTVPNATKDEVKSLIRDLKGIWTELDGQPVDRVAVRRTSLTHGRADRSAGRRATLAH
jgi:hypothetical protein